MDCEKCAALRDVEQEKCKVKVTFFFEGLPTVLYAKKTKSDARTTTTSVAVNRPFANANKCKKKRVSCSYFTMFQCKRTAAISPCFTASALLFTLIIQCRSSNKKWEPTWQHAISS